MTIFDPIGQSVFETQGRRAAVEGVPARRDEHQVDLVGPPWENSSIWTSLISNENASLPHLSSGRGVGSIDRQR